MLSSGKNPISETAPANNDILWRILVADKLRESPDGGAFQERIDNDPSSDVIDIQPCKKDKFICVRAYLTDTPSTSDFRSTKISRESFQFPRTVWSARDVKKNEIKSPAPDPKGTGLTNFAAYFTEIKLPDEENTEIHMSFILDSYKQRDLFFSEAGLIDFIAIRIPISWESIEIIDDESSEFNASILGDKREIKFALTQRGRRRLLQNAYRRDNSSSAYSFSLKVVLPKNEGESVIPKSTKPLNEATKYVECQVERKTTKKGDNTKSTLTITPVDPQIKYYNVGVDPESDSMAKFYYVVRKGQKDAPAANLPTDAGLILK